LKVVEQVYQRTEEIETRFRRAICKFFEAENCSVKSLLLLVWDSSGYRGEFREIRKTSNTHDWPRELIGFGDWIFLVDATTYQGIDFRPNGEIGLSINSRCDALQEHLESEGIKEMFTTL
jgi:hypothetical protein